MFPRALIVLLLVLNLGVATWWALRPASSPSPPLAQPQDAPRLQLLGETPQNPQSPMTVAAPATAAEVAAPAKPADTQRCFAFGPFIDATALAAARAALQPQVAKLHAREATASGRGWRVWLPPLPDRAAAQAMAARISAAGFTDYYIATGGDEANSIALGRFGNEAAAQHQQSALQAAGFPAQSEALGGKPTWLDVIATPTLDVAGTRKRIAAAQARPLDCSKLK